MDYKKIAGIIEAIAVAQNSAHTRTEEAQNAGAILKACSFGGVLTPIPNAKATIAALDAIRWCACKGEGPWMLRGEAHS